MVRRKLIKLVDSSCREYGYRLSTLVVGARKSNRWRHAFSFAGSIVIEQDVRAATPVAARPIQHHPCYRGFVCATWLILLIAAEFVMVDLYSNFISAGVIQTARVPQPSP